MITKRRLVAGAAGLATMGALLPDIARAQAAVAQAYLPARLPKSVVYVQSNTATPGQNSILGFRRAADGSLTPLPGSPFPTGGTGFFIANPALGPFDTDQEIILDRLTGFLYAANGGSSSVSVLKVNPDGSLTSLPGSPYATPGLNPVSPHPIFGGFAVLNADADPSQQVAGQQPSLVAAYVVAEGGTLVAKPGAPFLLPAGSLPTQILTDNTGPFIFTLEFSGAEIRSFIPTPNGSLRLLDVQVPPQQAGAASAPRPLGLWASDVAPILYVGFATTNQIGVYRYNDAGKLRFVATAPSSGQAPCWLRTGFNGQRLYVIKTGDSSISVFDTTRPDAPREIQNLTLDSLGALVQFAITPDNRYLYVLEQIVRQLANSAAIAQGNRLRVLEISPRDGSISEVTSAAFRLPVSDTTVPQGVIAL